MKKELKYLARIVRSNVGRLAYPYKIAFALTYRCDLRCSICSIWKKPSMPELSLEEIEKIFSPRNRFSWVVLTGGEPFLRDDIVPLAASIINNSKDLCVLSFPTNGYRTPVIIDAIRKITSLPGRLPRIVVTVSMDGGPATHDTMRGMRDSWKQSMETFLALKKMKGITAILSMTLSRHNLGMMDALIESIRVHYPPFDAARDFNVNMFHTSAHYFGNQDMRVPPARELLQELHHASRLLHRPVSIKGFLQGTYLSFAEQFVQTGQLPLPCQALSASLFMDPAGNLYPCHIYDRNLGNIREYGYRIDAFWDRAETVQLAGQCRRGECPRCWSPCEAYPGLCGSLRAAVPRYFRHQFCSKGSRE